MIIQLPPPPPPPCVNTCTYKYQVFMPIVQRPYDIVCNVHNYCDNLYQDKNGYRYVTDDGIYNDLYLSSVITINGDQYINVESYSADELPITNWGYVLIYIHTEGRYFYTIFTIVKEGL